MSIPRYRREESIAEAKRATERRPAPGRELKWKSDGLIERGDGAIDDDDDLFLFAALMTSRLGLLLLVIEQQA
jgi:hypothetical protein